MVQQYEEIMNFRCKTSGRPLKMGRYSAPKWSKKCCIMVHF